MYRTRCRGRVEREAGRRTLKFSDYELADTNMSFSILGGGKSQKKEPAAAQLIKETTTQDFVRDVLEASKEVGCSR